MWGCRYSSLDSSAVPSKPSMLLSIYVWIVSCGKDENKKRPGFAHIFKNNQYVCCLQSLPEIEPIMFVFSGHSGVPLKVRVLQARHQHAETSHVRLIVCRNSPILVCHTATQARPPGTTWPKSVGACGSQRARRSGMRSWTLRKDIMHHPLVIKKQSIPTR